jgi:FMN-dependent NADH-azoreductase
MKIIGIGSSARNFKSSKSALLLETFLNGMSEAGADVEIIHLKNKKIKKCVGCFGCWVSTPGKCLHNDDMSSEIFDKWVSSDIVVYSTPLFYHHMNSEMSRFIERLLPASKPFFEKNGDMTTHPYRDERTPKAVWISVCGFPNISEFDVFSNYIKRTFNKNLIAEIYRSASETMVDEKFEEQFKNILNATELAGREIVKYNKIMSETLNRITSPIADNDTIIENVNQHWLGMNAS